MRSLVAALLLLVAGVSTAGHPQQQRDRAATRCRTRPPSVGRVLACRDAIRRAPDDAALWVHMAWAFDSLAMHAPARRSFAQALALAPSNVDALVGLARMRGDSAEEYARRALALEPDNPVAHSILGARLLGRRGVHDSVGRAHLREALRLRPDYIAPYVNLADLFLGAKRPDSALQALDSARRIMPRESAYAWYIVAGLELSLGLPYAAERSTRQALALSPKFGAAWARLAEFAGAANDAPREVEYRRRAREAGYPDLADVGSADWRWRDWLALRGRVAATEQP